MEGNGHYVQPSHRLHTVIYAIKLKTYSTLLFQSLLFHFKRLIYSKYHIDVDVIFIAFIALIKRHHGLVTLEYELITNIFVGYPPHDPTGRFSFNVRSSREEVSRYQARTLPTLSYISPCNRRVLAR